MITYNTPGTYYAICEVNNGHQVMEFTLKEEKDVYEYFKTISPSPTVIIISEWVFKNRSIVFAGLDWSPVSYENGLARCKRLSEEP